MKQFAVTGMSCAACSARVEKAVSKVEGVSSVSVSLLTNTLLVEGEADSAEIIKAVEAAGYGATEKNKLNIKGNSAEEASGDQETKVLRRRLLFSLVLTGILMYFSMGYVMWNWPIPEFAAQNPIIIGVLQLCLALAVMVINHRFFVNGWKGILHKAPNMDTLVALGSGAAFVYSTCVLGLMIQTSNDKGVAFAKHYLHEFYFEAAAMILALITLGKMLESAAKGKTTDALRGLMKLVPETATLLMDGREQEVPIEKVQVGDIFLLRPGAKIPVDGQVLEGSSAVDESALTGESIPVDKAAGDKVCAGTLNQSGFLKCEATKVGEDTTLAHIIQMVSDGAATKAPIAKVADKVSGIFVPAVLLIALVTLGGWVIVGESMGFALARSISVLVISCPCALGLATPVAIMVGSGVGARHGILFKTAGSLEETGKAKIVVLDKTGTLTTGTPKVTDLLP